MGIKTPLEALEKLNHTICLNSAVIKWGVDEDDNIDCVDEYEFAKCYTIIRNALKRKGGNHNARTRTTKS